MLQVCRFNDNFWSKLVKDLLIYRLLKMLLVAEIQIFDESKELCLIMPITLFFWGFFLPLQN